MAEEAAVAVCVRVRPLNSREEELGEDNHIYWKTDSNAIYQTDGSRSFSFDRVFHSNETTKNVYEEIAVPIIDSAIQGYNGTIFAYGQTASGKTHTMMGSEDCLGVIPRAIHDIFQKIKKFPEREFLLRVSYMEIYNETITDLLCNTQKMKPLIIREDINRNVYVADLTEEVVYTSEMALKWITKGEKNRHYGITKMNQRSSRSHTIFRMILESREKGESSNCDGSIKVSHLNLVDLAGSERAAQTGAEGVRLKEGCNINRSLFILGQVIKRLSDGQIGGFINYRDSKLTRILQNSLGGNAKTRIICTITPVSFDETLTTLQFASTAKYMKNTPYVNEVSSDEALLKRYRKEIVDLKKQLEEVNTKTRAQEMEKDQLAQLLDEKDLLQKVQDEKIQNLKRMLVTSSSLASQQELTAKRKRRVTWCFGKTSKTKDSNYVNEFKVPTNVTTRKTSSVSLLGEIDESLCSESDVFSNTLEPLAEVEWNSATKILNEENLESEFNSLHAKYNSLVLDYEQLRRENEELGLKLKEKNDLDEFEALEKKAEKDHEMQLIHEISNLKNLVKHAEMYNQDLENELSSKVELLKEKDEQIKNLQEHIDSQKSGNLRMDLSYSSENTEDLKQMKQTLFDTETVALDAKKESAFLRSENLELKEKMKELSSSCKQMENDIQLYQRQLEAKKKMQVDLDKELQSAFNEIARLNSLIDGKVPKDLLSNLELENRITDLQRELHKKSEENETLQKEVHLLSELKSLPSEIEMLRKEIHEKSEELDIVTLEKEKLFSEVAHKDSRIQGLLQEIGNAKDDLAASQFNYKNTEEEFQTCKALHVEFEQKYKVVLEENERMKQEMRNLSTEADLGLTVDSLKRELSQKTQELQQRSAEGQEKLDKLEQLKEELESRESMLQSMEKEKTRIADQLQQALEEVRALTQEKDALKQLQESLQSERDQLQSDIQDTVNMNIDTQEQLRNALESLKQHQETINSLRVKAEENRASCAVENKGDAEGEFQQKMGGIAEEQNPGAKDTQTLIADLRDNEVTEQQRRICSLIQEKQDLQQMLESMTAEKEQLKMDLQENIEMTIENQEQLRILGDELKRQQEIVMQEKNHAAKKDEELSRACDRVAGLEEQLKEKSEQLQEKQQELLSIQEETSKMQKKVTEMENLKNELRTQEIALQQMEMEKLELTQRLHENCEEMKSVTKERNDLKELQKASEIERTQLKEYAREIEAAGLRTKEELNIAHVHLKEHQDTIDELKRIISEKEAQISNTQKDIEESNTKSQEEIPVLSKEEKLLPIMHEGSEILEMVNEREALVKQSKALHSATPENSDMERLGLIGKLQEGQEAIKSLTDERDDLKMMKEALQTECDQLKEDIRNTWAKEVQKEEELRIARVHLKEHQETIDKLRGIVSEKTDEVSNMQGDLEHANATLKAQIQELQEKEYQLCKVKDDLRETVDQREQLKKQLEVQNLTLENTEAEKLRLTQKLHENLEEIRLISEENDNLRVVEESLRVERDQLRESLGETEANDLKKERELTVAHLALKEHQETIDKLRRTISEMTQDISNMKMDLENSNSKFQQKIQELTANELQLMKLKGDISEAQKQLKEQGLTLNKIEMENLNLAQKLHENTEEMKSIIKERDNMKRVEEMLKLERDQLKESLREAIARIQEFEKKKELQLLIMKEDVSKSCKKMNEMEQLKKQFEAQNLSVQNMGINNLHLMIKKVHENLEEIRIIAKESSELRRMKESLRTERDRFRETMRKVVIRDYQNHKEITEHEKRMVGEEEHLPERLREKCLQIKELLQRYSEMGNDYECLNTLSLDLEKEIETQKRLLMAVKSNLSLPCLQTKQIQKLLTTNQRCSLEFHRVVKKFKYVLSNVKQIKEEQHDSINKLEMAFIDEVEKQNELRVQIQRLQQGGEVPFEEPKHLKLNQAVDLHIEEILKDFSENDFPSIKNEFQQVLSNRKKMTQFLEKWLATSLDVEKLKNIMQKENDNIHQVNNLYNNKIAAIISDSTEFEERSAARSKEWEHDLKSMKETTRTLIKAYQTLSVSQSTAHVCLTTQDTKNCPGVSGDIQLTTERIQKLETSLREAQESAIHKEGKIIKMQKELEMNNDIITKLQTKVNESNKCLETTKETIQTLENKVALGAQPYREEIEELKTKLVKLDLEKKKNAKEFEKEIHSTKATIDHQKEVIRLLRENLRRNQQAQDTSILSEQNAWPSNKPLTCGGGSGIVQSTKALILKSEYVRLEKEMSKLKQHNEQLIKQKNELLSENHHLSNEVKTWKEKILKREAFKEAICENSPKSPKVTGTDSKRRQNTPSQSRERNLHDAVPKESPKPWFFDNRSKSLPAPHPIHYFDNSSLGLCPEEEITGAENVDPTDSWRASSGKDVPECKMQ